MFKCVSVCWLVCLFGFDGYAQNLVAPGSSVFQKGFIKNGTSQMGYYAYNEGQWVEICHFNISINHNNQSFSVITSLKFLASGDLWADTSISDPNTFKAVYRSSVNNKRAYSIKFGNEVNGTYLDKESGKRSTIKESSSNGFFESYSYPYLLGLLPLNLGYKADLPVYDYIPGNKTNVKKARVEEVRNGVYKSNLTGEHKVWLVNVVEESTGDKYDYYIDKETRRIWKIEVYAKNVRLMLVDKEIDFYPYKTRFDKVATMNMIKSGNSVISGQAFARDNKAPIKGIAILNVNKKQMAPKGTSIVLIPYTEFFKEWIELNKASRKKGVSMPLPQDVVDCIKTTTIYDDEGHFDFVNLMPGEYLVYTEFRYVHTVSRSEVVGYTDTYINGMFQGSTANTRTYSYDTNASAAVQKIVTIKKDGDKETIKLKKTL